MDEEGKEKSRTAWIQTPPKLLLEFFGFFFLLALKPHQSEVHENKLFVPKRRINSYHVVSSVNYDGQ